MSAVGQIWRVVSNDSFQQTWEATEPGPLTPGVPYLRGRLVTQTTTSVGSRDAFDNVLQQHVTIADHAHTATGTQPVRYHDTITTADYTNDLTTWWLGRLDRQTVQVEQEYVGTYASGAPAQPAQGRRTATLYAYDGTLRTPTCEALFSGANTPPVGASCGNQPNAERRVTRTFDGFGNVISETTVARGEETQPRTISTSYADSAGYFPQAVTDGFGETVKSTVSRKFGVPVSTTDANDLVTTVQLDPLGRPVRTVPPVRAALQLGFPAVTAYERCSWLAPGLCPQHAVLRVIQSQYGAPQVLTYTDVLGRTLRTGTKLLHAAFEAEDLTDANASVSETVYTSAGQVQWQYEPDEGGPNPNARTEFAYDDLNRPVVKRQRFFRVHDTLETGLNFRRTEYTYQGLRTDIAVCQTATEGTTCAQIGGNFNADGSPKLAMSRQFDAPSACCRPPMRMVRPPATGSTAREIRCGSPTSRA